jgi:hypothetical protein
MAVVGDGGVLYFPMQNLERLRAASIHACHRDVRLSGVPLESQFRPMPA